MEDSELSPAVESTDTPADEMRRQIEQLADNLRKLENFVKRYVVFAGEKRASVQLNELEPLDRPYPPDPPQHSPEVQPQALSGPRPVASLNVTGGICDLKSLVRGLKREAERVAIVQALEYTGGNKQEAASLLHISLRALHYKVRAYGIGSTHARVQMACATGHSPAMRINAAGSAISELPRKGTGKLISMKPAANCTPAPSSAPTGASVRRAAASLVR